MNTVKTYMVIKQFGLNTFFKRLRLWIVYLPRDWFILTAHHLSLIYSSIEVMESRSFYVHIFIFCEVVSLGCFLYIVLLNKSDF